MGHFRLYLIGSASPMEVELPARDIHELDGAMSTAKFVTGTMAEPDDDGVCAAFLVPTCRIQCVVER